MTTTYNFGNPGPGLEHVFSIPFVCVCFLGPGVSMSQVVGLPNNSYKPITNTAWVRARLCKLQKGCTQIAAASNKVYQLLAHGRWFSPGTPASSITKTGRHDIAELLLKVALRTINQFKSNQILISPVMLSIQTLNLYIISSTLDNLNPMILLGCNSIHFRTIAQQYLLF